MGHSIEHQYSFGQCHLSQCSCGRGALKVRDKVILLSSAEVREMTGLFINLTAGITPGISPLATKMKSLIGGPDWGDFSVPL